MSFNGIGATGGVCHFRFHSFVCVGSEPGGWMSQLTALRADRSQPAPGGGPVPGSGNHGGYGPVDTFIGQKGRMRPEGVRRSRAWTVVRLVGLRIWICRIVTTSSRVSCGNGHADGRVRWRDGATVGQKHPRVVERIMPLHRRSTLARVERDDSRSRRGRTSRMRTRRGSCGEG
jgi:hypothetical protein